MSGRSSSVIAAPPFSSAGCTIDRKLGDVNRLWLIDLAPCWTFTSVTLPAAPTATEPDQSASRRARLEALFDAHGRAVYAYARRRAGAADADEVVSETFLVVWRRLDDVPAEARPWLLGVARRCLANVTRGEARQFAVKLRLADTAPAPVADVQQQAMSSEVRRSLDRLSPGEREAITLVAWDGLTPDEVATTLGCSRAAVYLRLHRARRRLARDLRPDGDPEDKR
jgi:RNA polymerase sigma-70 factor (ECF subfamily)